ncbi:uncharacterized protein TNCT_189211 [Trichonephila clavata]|uniref:MBD domain-containing protein n=1 Tax=Trichonephila clavata TaxID=2740835 RepID=A0A8X6HSX3_TRICU|nr:uncharacterized protein TNCT_189211 [Trichonephila clavata]
MMDAIQGVTLLTASNWEVWKIEIKVSLMHYGAWEFIEKEESNPEIEAKLSWRDRCDLKLRKDRAFTLIYQNISNEFKPLISGTTDGAEAWKILQEHFEPNTRARKIQLLDEFFGTRYVPGENLGLFICRVKRSAERLREVGHDLPPLYQGYQMIRSLPDDFRTTVQAIYRWSNKDFVPDKIEAELLLEENRLGVVKKDLEDVSTFAFSDEVKHKIKKQKSKFQPKSLDVNSNSYVKSSKQVVKSSNVVIETINVRFDEGKKGVDSGKTFTGPVRNYLLKDFPEDGDIFSAVGDRADHPEADSERDTRTDGAGSESQTVETPTLRPCVSIPWIRKPVERKDRSRKDIYYFVEGSNARLRSFNEIQKYCKDNNIEYDQNLFNFSGKNSSSGKVADLLNLPLEEEANLAEVRIPKTYKEATRTPEAADWEDAMDKEMQVIYDRNVWNLVEPPKEAKVLGSFGFIEVRLDDGVTFPAGWCVNRVSVPWMSTSSPQYRLGEGENVIRQSAHLGDSGTVSTSF